MTAPAHLRLLATPRETTDPRLGASIDERYVIDSLLGRGGMGVVYRARHRALDKTVAVKVLEPGVSREGQILARFEREARAASAIGSPHICDVSDFGTLSDGSTYFVMELLDGPSLATVIGRDAPMPTDRILRIAKQLCDALGAAHAAGIVHRDLKPDNVHLVPRGGDAEFVKVLDFGIAKIAGSGETKLTVAGQVFGTPHYMSPEQCSGFDVDARTDVYALGVMLYEMACGRLPFDADNLMGLLTKHVYEQPIAPRDLGLGVEIPAGLEAIILTCLAKQPASRYASMAALRADIEALERSETPRAVFRALDRNTPPRALPPVALPRPATTPTAPPRRRTPFAAIASLLLAGAIALGAAYGLASSSRANAPAAKATAPKAIEEVIEEPMDRPTDTRIEPRVDAVGQPSVMLHTDPPGAEVYGPDGALIGNTPLAVPRPAVGEPALVYRVSAPRFRDRAIPVGATTTAELTVRLDRRGRPAPDAPPPEGDPNPPGFETIEPLETDLIDPFEEAR